MSLPPVRGPRRKVVSSYKDRWTFTATLACGHVLDYVSPYKRSCPKAVSCYKCLKARKEEEDRMDTTTETETTTEDKKPRKPMSQEQKDAISKTLKAKWRKRRAEQGAVGTLPAPAKKKSKAKPKQALAPATGDARAAVERYNATVKAAKEELRAALRRAIEEL